MCFLSSVFGPFSQDDEFSSRGDQSARAVSQPGDSRAGSVLAANAPHRSWGIMLIQENISALYHVARLPTRERFIEELQSTYYDIVGLSASS